MRKIIISLFLLVCTAVIPTTVKAVDQICVTQYGGGTVCGARTPEFHAPVKAGLADINLPLLSVGFLGIAGVLYFKSRRSLTQ